MASIVFVIVATKQSFFGGENIILCSTKKNVLISSCFRSYASPRSLWKRKKMLINSLFSSFALDWQHNWLPQNDPPLHPTALRCVHCYTKSKTSASSWPRGQETGLFSACTCFLSFQSPAELLLDSSASPRCFMLNRWLASAPTSPAHAGNIRPARQNPPHPPTKWIASV